jgi:hypothetical protein
MFTSFFNTSKPVHFIIAGGFLFVIFTIYRFYLDVLNLTLSDSLNHFIIYLVLLVSLLVFAFFVDKNDLTHKNSYKILFFCLLLALLPQSLLDNNVVISNLFIMLALRRIVSLRNNLRVKKKLFDGAFWITMASLFYFWSILFFIMLILALILFSIGQMKNWIVPFAGVLVVVIVVTSFNILTTDSFGDVNNLVQVPDFDFTSYNDITFIVPITIFLSLGIWALFHYLGSLRGKARIYRPAFLTIVVALAISLGIVILAPNKNGNEFIFAIAPMAIIMSNYIELIKEKWFAEVYIWIITLVPTALWMMDLGSKG